MLTHNCSSISETASIARGMSLSPCLPSDVYIYLDIDTFIHTNIIAEYEWRRDDGETTTEDPYFYIAYEVEDG